MASVTMDRLIQHALRVRVEDSLVARLTREILSDSILRYLHPFAVFQSRLVRHDAGDRHV